MYSKQQWPPYRTPPSYKPTSFLPEGLAIRDTETNKFRRLQHCGGWSPHNYGIPNVNSERNDFRQHFVVYYDTLFRSWVLQLIRSLAYWDHENCQKRNIAVQKMESRSQEEEKSGVSSRQEENLGIPMCETFSLGFPHFFISYEWWRRFYKRMLKIKNKNVTMTILLA